MSQFIPRNSRNRKTLTGLDYPFSDPQDVNFSIVPDKDNTYYLGTALKRWSAVYTFNMYVESDMNINGDIIIDNEVTHNYGLTITETPVTDEG